MYWYIFKHAARTCDETSAILGIPLDPALLAFRNVIAWGVADPGAIVNPGVARPGVERDGVTRPEPSNPGVRRPGVAKAGVPRDAAVRLGVGRPPWAEARGVAVNPPLKVSKGGCFCGVLGRVNVGVASGAELDYNDKQETSSKFIHLSSSTRGCVLYKNQLHHPIYLKADKVANIK